MATLCTECSKELKYVVDETVPDQCEGAIGLYIEGGYGMYFDSDCPIVAILCKDCVNKFMRLFPNLSQLTKEAPFM